MIFYNKDWIKYRRLDIFKMKCLAFFFAGKTTEYSYDSKGYLVSVKDSSGTMSFVYDSVGNLTKQTNANGEGIFIW